MLKKSAPDQVLSTLYHSSDIHTYIMYGITLIYCVHFVCIKCRCVFAMCEHCLMSAVLALNSRTSW